MARVPWYRFPVFVSLIKLLGFRIELRRRNLHNTQPDMPIKGDPDKVDPQPTERQRQARTVEGTHNDLGVPKMGSAGQRFGRNIPLADAGPDPNIEDPNPRVVSNRLLARTDFVPATIVNLLAAAWIQFEIHDWMTHGKNEKENPFKVPVDDDDAWPGPRPMEIRRTRADTTRTPAEQDLPPTYTNAETHWWDGSQVYGSRQPIADKVRSHKGIIGVAGSPAHAPSELFDQWKQSSGKNCLIYFYCHADGANLALSTKSITANTLRLQLKRNEVDGSPTSIVFLNGCSTAAGHPMGGFLEATGPPSFAGFVGTEAPVPDMFALRFGTELLHKFLSSGKDICSVVHELRRAHWPLGLLYSVCCYPKIAVVPPMSLAHITEFQCENFSTQQIGSADDRTMA